MNGTESWGKYPQRHRVHRVVERSPEAHHVLPVASVTGEITANEQQSRSEVVENTKWCVNDLKANMIALPLFEMTFLHYLITGRQPPRLSRTCRCTTTTTARSRRRSPIKLKKIGKDAATEHQGPRGSHGRVAGRAERRSAITTSPNSRRAAPVAKATHGEFVYAMNATRGRQVRGTVVHPVFDGREACSKNRFPPALERADWPKSSPT